MSSPDALLTSLVNVLGPGPTGVLLILLVGFLFLLLVKVCNEAVVPAFKYASEWSTLPPDVASALFVALGSATPQILVSLVSTLVHVNDTKGVQEVSLGMIYGSAIMSFTLIPALCVLVSPQRRLTLNLAPLVRDCSFFGFGLLLFMTFVEDGDITWRECAMLLALFFVYLFIMGAFVQYVKRRTDPANLPTEREDTSTLLDSENGSTTEASTGEDNTTEAPATTSSPEASANSPTNPLTKFYHLRCFSYLHPPFCINEATFRRRWGWIMVASFLYIALIAEGCLEFTAAFADLIGLNQLATGVIFVALGAQVPNIVASVAIARDGNGPASMANAIGSQVMNILIGVGLPYLVATIIKGRMVLIDDGSAEVSGGLLVPIALGFFFLVCRQSLIRRLKTLYGTYVTRHVELVDVERGQTSTVHTYGLSVKDALILIILYLVFAIVELSYAQGKGSSSDDGGNKNTTLSF